MGYCYDNNGRLACDYCGSTGDTRKHRCPHGWCPPVAACRQCRRKHAEDFRRPAHKQCRRASERYDAEKRRENDLLNAGLHVRCSAIGLDREPGGDDLVRVTFRNAANEEIERVMSSDTYRALPIGQPATVGDFDKWGDVAMTIEGYRRKQSAQAEKAVQHG